ncbi:MAG TPA: hypothetical protein H9720_04220 [Candidatus Limosilactobacillus intestinigallinarum]|jgi:hypothetical protein|nr:hypothetical protein [Candidatus Limosilactobacillus intestinigallinarum]
MSKYERLWKYIVDSGQDQLTIPFSAVERITGIPLDYSFLGYKKELLDYGYQVDHIFLKKQEIQISRIK